MRLKNNMNEESLLFFISNNIKIHMLRNLRSEIVKICLIFYSTKAIAILKSLISPINDEIYFVLDTHDLIDLPYEEKIREMVR
jgi:hypothetical protein